MTGQWRCDIQNLHTHTIYSDGANTPEEMVLAAIEKGFDSIGFSEHSYIKEIPGKWLMPEKMPEYLAQLDMLKEKYADKIKIFKGIEYDSMSTFSTENFDYVIGNVHYCPLIDGTFMPYTSKRYEGKEKILSYYEMDAIAYTRDYYERFTRSMYERKIDIVGHIDTLTKFSKTFGISEFFETKEYRDIALDALRVVKSKCDLFEVNVANISRGIRTCPNPAPFLIRELKALGARVLVTADAHNTDMLDKSIDTGLEILLECGFNTIWVYTENGFKEQKII